jgi:hypothetical protein
MPQICKASCCRYLSHSASGQPARETAGRSRTCRTPGGMEIRMLLLHVYVPNRIWPAGTGDCKKKSYLQGIRCNMTQ